MTVISAERGGKEVGAIPALFAALTKPVPVFAFGNDPGYRSVRPLFIAALRRRNREQLGGIKRADAKARSRKAMDTSAGLPTRAAVGLKALSG